MYYFFVHLEVLIPKFQVSMVPCWMSGFNSLDENVFVRESQTVLSPSYIILRIQRLEANSGYLDEVAYYEPPHQDLCCLQVQIFSSLLE